MGSWIKCNCGNNIHKNLFSGANLSVLIKEEDLDSLDLNESAKKFITQLITRPDILVQCKNCNRIVIFNDSRNEYRFYSQES